MNFHYGLILIISIDKQGLYAEIISLYSFRRQISNSYTLQLPEGKQPRQFHPGGGIAPNPTTLQLRRTAPPLGWSCCGEAGKPLCPPRPITPEEIAIASTAKPWQRFGGQTPDLHKPSGLVREDSYREKPRKLKYPSSPKQRSFGRFGFLFVFMLGIVLFFLASSLSFRRKREIMTKRKYNFN